MIPKTVDWLAEHYVLDPQAATGGRFDPNFAAWLSAPGGPLEAWDDPLIRELVIVSPAQGGKTTTVQGVLLHGLTFNPGPTMFVLPAKDEVEAYFDSRLYPTIKACGPLAAVLPRDRYGIRKDRINFPSGILLGVGANSGSKLSGKPILNLFCDEEKDYPPGQLEKAKRRTSSFTYDHKIFRISTPTEEGKNIHGGFLVGCQALWHNKCPSCGHEEPAKLSRLKWDDTLPTFDERAATLHLHCSKCHHGQPDTPEVRLRLATDGRWIKKNPEAPRSMYSCQWSSLIVPWIRWRTILDEYERAQRALFHGQPIPWRVFQSEVMGEAYRVEDEDNRSDVPVGEYANGDEWSEEFARFLTGDVQQDRIEFVCRAFSSSGESRLVREGTVRSFEEFEALRSELQVDPRKTGIDVRHKRGETLRACYQYGWTALEGERRDGGYKVKVGTRITSRPYSKANRIDIGLGSKKIGKMVWHIAWSNRLIKDQLNHLSQGKAGNWTVGHDTSEEYFKQMRAEKLVTRYDTGGHEKTEWVMTNKRSDNHRWDCECEIIVLAMMHQLLDDGSSDTVET